MPWSRSGRVLQIRRQYTGGKGCVVSPSHPSASEHPSLSTPCRDIRAQLTPLAVTTQRLWLVGYISTNHQTFLPSGERDRDDGTPLPAWLEHAMNDADEANANNSSFRKGTIND